MGVHGIPSLEHTEWEVLIANDRIDRWYWSANPMTPCDIDNMLCSKYYKRRDLAKAAWRRFADKNGFVWWHYAD